MERLYVVIGQEFQFDIHGLGLRSTWELYLMSIWTVRDWILLTSSTWKDSTFCTKDHLHCHMHMHTRKLHKSQDIQLNFCLHPVSYGVILGVSSISRSTSELALVSRFPLSQALHGSWHGELLNSQQVPTPMQSWPSQKGLFSKNWKLSCPDVYIVSTPKLTEGGALEWKQVQLGKPDNYENAILHSLWTSQ